MPKASTKLHTLAPRMNVRLVSHSALGSITLGSLVIITNQSLVSPLFRRDRARTKESACKSLRLSGTFYRDHIFLPRHYVGTVQRVG